MPLKVMNEVSFVWRLFRGSVSVSQLFWTKKFINETSC